MKSLKRFILGIGFIFFNQLTNQAASAAIENSSDEVANSPIEVELEFSKLANKYVVPADDAVLVDLMTDHSFRPFREPSIVRRTLPDVIHFLDWNILKGKRAEFANEFLNFSKQKDLIFTQEAMNDNNVPLTFKKSKLDNWWMAQSFLYILTSFGTGVATGSDATPEHVYFQRSSDIEPLIHTPKIAIFTEYRTESGKKILTVNIHAVNFVTYNKFVRQISAVKEVIQNYSGGVIFAGDFNAWSKRRLAYLKDMADELNMEMTNFNDDHRHYKFDYLFVRGCHIKNADIHYESVGSDHNPITGIIDCSSLH